MPFVVNLDFLFLMENNTTVAEVGNVLVKAIKTKNKKAERQRALKVVFCYKDLQVRIFFEKVCR
jgi:hypothetical protein